jgi:hypothetical protein
VSRDIQVIINGGAPSKPKRQRYDPAKAKKRKKGKFKGKFIPREQFLAKMKAKYGDKGTSLNTQDSARDPSRDFSDDVRHLSLTALGRLLRQYHQRGDEDKCHIIEKEIDRRTKHYFGKGRR